MARHQVPVSLVDEDSTESKESARRQGPPETAAQVRTERRQVLLSDGSLRQEEVSSVRSSAPPGLEAQSAVAPRGSTQLAPPRKDPAVSLDVNEQESNR